jgi:hypothetical protein
MKAGAPAKFVRGSVEHFVVAMVAFRVKALSVPDFARVNLVTKRRWIQTIEATL